MKTFNKATAATVAGALITLFAAFVEVDAEVLAAAQTMLTAVLVYIVPNVGAQ